MLKATEILNQLGLEVVRVPHGGFAYFVANQNRCMHEIAGHAALCEARDDVPCDKRLDQIGGW